MFCRLTCNRRQYSPSNSLYSEKLLHVSSFVKIFAVQSKLDQTPHSSARLLFLYIYALYSSAHNCIVFVWEINLTVYCRLYCYACYVCQTEYPRMGAYTVNTISKTEFTITFLSLLIFQEQNYSAVTKLLNS